jgi:hypothetical protein
VGTVGKTLGHLGVTALLRAGVVLAGFAVTATAAGVAWGAQDVALSMTRPVGGVLTIDGSISGVLAGAPSAPLRLTLHNSGAEARAVSRVRADSTGVRSGDAACAAGDYLTVGEWNGTVSVPANGTATVTLPVAVSADLPESCVTASWGLVYTAY